MDPDIKIYREGWMSRIQFVSKRGKFWCLFNMTIYGMEGWSINVQTEHIPDLIIEFKKARLTVDGD